MLESTRENDVMATYVIVSLVIEAGGLWVGWEVGESRYIFHASSLLRRSLSNHKRQRRTMLVEWTVAADSLCYE